MKHRIYYLSLNLTQVSLLLYTNFQLIYWACFAHYLYFVQTKLLFCAPLRAQFIFIQIVNYSIIQFALQCILLLKLIFKLEHFWDCFVMLSILSFSRLQSLFDKHFQDPKQYHFRLTHSLCIILMSSGLCCLLWCNLFILELK